MNLFGNQRSPAPVQAPWEAPPQSGQRGRVIPALQGEAHGVSSETHQQDAPQLCSRKYYGGEGRHHLLNLWDNNSRQCIWKNIAGCSPGTARPLLPRSREGRAAAPLRARRWERGVCRVGAQNIQNQTQRCCRLPFAFLCDFMTSSRRVARPFHRRVLHMGSGLARLPPHVRVCAAVQE